MSNQNADDSHNVALEEMEVSINDVDTQHAEETITGALRGLPGIRAMRVAQGGVMVSFNPLGITKEEICTSITRAGFTIDGVQTGRQSPMNPNPQPTKEPLDHLRPPPKVHKDTGGHEGQ